MYKKKKLRVDCTKFSVKTDKTSIYLVYQKKKKHNVKNVFFFEIQPHEKLYIFAYGGNINWQQPFILIAGNRQAEDASLGDKISIK